MALVLEAAPRGRPREGLEADELCNVMGLFLEAGPRGQPRQGLRVGKLRNAMGLCLEPGPRGQPRKGLGAAKLRKVMGLFLEAGPRGRPRGWSLGCLGAGQCAPSLIFSSTRGLEAGLQEGLGAGTCATPCVFSWSPGLQAGLEHGLGAGKCAMPLVLSSSPGLEAGPRGLPRGWSLQGLGAGKFRTVMGLFLEAGPRGRPRGSGPEGRSKHPLRSTEPFLSQAKAPGRPRGWRPQGVVCEARPGVWPPGSRRKATAAGTCATAWALSSTRALQGGLEASRPKASERETHERHGCAPGGPRERAGRAAPREGAVGATGTLRAVSVQKTA